METPAVQWVARHKAIALGNGTAVIGVIALESSYRIGVTCFDQQKLFAKVSFRNYEQALLACSNKE
jgi:hypothetical protein